ncbi:excitatory amino acid transporter 3-like isoform X2 [Micropterus dolomieu]|uniref:excitatory amino acid transporter 3-like isoform X2 n=1 Tax=Micropterus dolomieu TaxID=147949 RepID=UPI001E8CF592|nr:excitatory amino acid transporter 3-like isoform X2 [Micropterus dolomieu]
MENNVAEEHNVTSSTGCPYNMKKCCDGYIQHNTYLASSLIAVGLGVSLGLILKIFVPLSEFDELHVGFPGEMLMRMLQLVSIPLIATNVIRSISALNIETCRRISLRAAAYFLITTLLAVSTGLLLVMLINPGVAKAVEKDETDDEESFDTLSSLLDLVRNIVPQNLIQACFEQYKTERVEFETDTEGHEEEHELQSSLETFQNSSEVQMVGRYVTGANTVGVIVWCFFFGITLNIMGKEGKVLVEVLTVFNDATKCVVNLILWYLPFGVVFLIASHIVEIENWESVYSLGKFVVVVVAGLTIHGTITLPLLYFLCVRRNPYAVIKVSIPALMTALAISSSSATMPLTLKCCEQLYIDKRITSFMLPIGTNLNKDGTALYEVVAAIFIAQLNHITLDFSQLIIIFMTSAVASIGAAGIPSTGAVNTLLVLTAIGLPARVASILVAVEWLLDHFNTLVNVLGNCIGLVIVHELSKKDLDVREEQGQEMTRMHGSDSDSQVSDDDTLPENLIPPKECDAEEPTQRVDQSSEIRHITPEQLYNQESDDKEPAQREDQSSDICHITPEYLSSQDSDDYENV